MPEWPSSSHARTSTSTFTRRPRVSRACVACQQKKQKCDGQSPACRNCLRANRECISQDPSTQRQHPRGYLESLEKHNGLLEQHVAFLEKKIQLLQPDIDMDNLRSGSVESAYLPESGGHSQDDDSVMICSSDSLAKRNESHVDDFSSLGLLCLQSAGGDPHYFGTSSAYSFTKMFSATLRAVRSQGPGLTMAGIPVASGQLTQSRPTPVSLPDRAITSMLTTTYFDQVHPQFPFLHQPSYLKWEEEVMDAIENGTPDPTELFFVYAVAAVGALTGPLAGAMLPEGLYASAGNLFEHVIKLNSLESIQAILCCCMYSIRSPVGVSVWTLSGLALRQCIELGLHRNIPWSKVESDVLKMQMRRRVFWCSYNIDRAVAVTLGRPVGITDTDIDVEYYLDINDEHITVSGLLAEPRRSKADLITTVSAAIHIIRVNKIWARIQSLIYPQTGLEALDNTSLALIDNFQSELKEWLDNAPDQLPSNRAHNNAFGSPEWFRLIYHHSILLLHRQVLVSHHSSVRPEVTASKYLKCAQSAQAICTIYRQLYISQRLHDTWGALHLLFLGGVTFVHCLWVSPETRAAFRLDKVATTCTSCMVVLAVMAERWAAVQPYRDAFDMLSNATQTMLAEGESVPTAPAMPILSSSGNDQLSDYLSHMAELGMCSSVEALLSNMIN